MVGVRAPAPPRRSRIGWTTPEAPGRFNPTVRRHEKVEMVRHNGDRIVKASEAAALGTSTRVEHEIIHGLYPLLPNETLSKRLDANLQEVGGVTNSLEEMKFAKKTRKTFSISQPLGAQEKVEP